MHGVVCVCAIEYKAEYHKYVEDEAEGEISPVCQLGCMHECERKGIHSIVQLIRLFSCSNYFANIVSNI